MINDFILALSSSIQSGLFVDEIAHGVVTLPFVFFLYLKTKSIRHSVVALLVTYLIDMDHWVDYFLYWGADISLVKFVDAEYFQITQRAVVPLHAWEWLFFLAALSVEQKKWKSILVGVTLGVFAHLIWDSHTVGSVIFYSILYRIYHGFILII